MRALASAAKLVPYDSALFVVTDKGAGDPQRLPLALRALVEKRLKVREEGEEGIKLNASPILQTCIVLGIDSRRVKS